MVMWAQTVKSMNIPIFEIGEKVRLKEELIGVPYFQKYFVVDNDVNCTYDFGDIISFGEIGILEDKKHCKIIGELDGLIYKIPFQCLRKDS